MPFRQSTAAVNAIADAMGRLYDGGALRLYGGAQPSSVTGAPSTLLAEVRFSATAFYPANEGVIIAQPMQGDPSAKATGDATWYRAVSATGAVLHDGSVGKRGTNLTMVSTAISAGVAVNPQQFSLTVPKE